MDSANVKDDPNFVVRTQNFQKSCLKSNLIYPYVKAFL